MAPAPLAPTLAFLTDLSHHNNRPWFEAQRAEYLGAKAAIEEFFFAQFPALGLDRGSHPASFYFHRIHRDVRFARGQPPYKTSLSAVYDPQGKKTPGFGAYFHIEPGNESVVGGGLWRPEPAVLKKFRLDMEDGPRAFLKIVESPEFRAHLHLLDGERLQKVPRGFSEDHPAAELFKLKQVCAWRSFTDAEVLAPDFADQVVGAVKAMQPFLRYLEEAVGSPG